MKAASSDSRRLPGYLFVAAFAISVSVMILRRHDLVTNPQFWAEDGSVWYADAYTYGPWLSLIRSHAGYFVTIARLTMSVAQWMPLYYVPLFANLVALSIRATAVCFLLSKRVGWADIRLRAIVACYILLMPLSEVHANITNTQWYLAIYMFTILLAKPAQSWQQRLHDDAVVLLSGLSGPFIIFMTPFLWPRLIHAARVGGHSIRTEVRRECDLLCVWFFATAVQLISITSFAGTERAASHTGLGATFLLFVKIVGAAVFAGFALPESWIPRLAAHDALMYSICVASFLVIVSVAICGDWRARSITLFCMILMAAALISPLNSETQPQWPLFLEGGSGRYFLIPRIGWVSILLYFFVYFLGNFAKPIIMAITVFVAIAVSPAFLIPPLPNTKWREQVNRFDNSPGYARVRLDIDPPGWSMLLTKRRDRAGDTHY